RAVPLGHFAGRSLSRTHPRRRGLSRLGITRGGRLMGTPAGSPSLRIPGVSLSRVMASEWIKLRSLQSSTVALIASIVIVVGAGIVTAAAVAGSMADGSWDPGGDPFSPHDATAAVLYGVQFAQLLIGV